MTEERRFLVASRSHLMNALVESFLQCHRYGRVIHRATTGREALRAAKTERPDWVVMESVIQEPCGVEVVRKLRGEIPKIRIIAFARRTNLVNAVRLVKAGVTSYLSAVEDAAALKKNVESILMGKRVLPREVHELLEDRDFELNGRRYHELSRRETEIIELVALGYSNSEIGGKCGISSRTVEQHRRHISDKTGLRTIADMTRFAMEEGIVGE